MTPRHACIIAAVLLSGDLVCADTLHDAASLLQTRLGSSRGGPPSSVFIADLLRRSNLTVEKIEEVLNQSRPILHEQSEMAGAMSQAAKSATASKETLARGWWAAVDSAKAATAAENATPEALLQHATAALIQTGAMDTMRQLANATSRAMKPNRPSVVPLDSMIIGFRSSFAPWNNLLKNFGAPLIKANYRLFANFFGPAGDGGRLCIASAVAIDSKYREHRYSEFGGIHLFVGPAKWDNVPGWSFGTSGGFTKMKSLDVADFGWEWTLAGAPETVGFHYDICLIDALGLLKRPALLQTQASRETRHPMPSSDVTHASTWTEHVWCSPDWINTPLFIEVTTTTTTTPAGEKLAEGV